MSSGVHCMTIRTRLVILARQAGSNSQRRLNGRILLVEDGEDNQCLISFLLKKAGAEVEIAENGSVALEKMEIAASAPGSRPFGLILSDMQMPVMDGYTLARTLRERGDHIPIVALTAHAMAEDRERCLDAGCDDYLSKPIDRHSLLEACFRWLAASARKGRVPSSEF